VVHGHNGKQIDDEDEDCWSSRKGKRIGYGLPVIVDLARLAVGLRKACQMCPRHFITSALPVILA